MAGIIGFFYSASFGGPGDVDAVFGILDVNAWHNVVHLLTGGLGLLAFSAGAYAARQYAFALGAVYILVAIIGFIYGDGDAILGFIPINTEDNVLHLLLGLAGLGAGAATPEAGPALRARSARPSQETPRRPGSAYVSRPEVKRSATGDGRGRLWNGPFYGRAECAAVEGRGNSPIRVPASASSHPLAALGSFRSLVSLTYALDERRASSCRSVWSNKRDRCASYLMTSSAESLRFADRTRRSS